jgi:membrane-associated HD superfamily phosphohydrolase
LGFTSFLNLLLVTQMVEKVFKLLSIVFFITVTITVIVILGIEAYQNFSDVSIVLGTFLGTVLIVVMISTGFQEVVRILDDYLENKN